jgi:hypothetical protein
MLDFFRRLFGRKHRETLARKDDPEMTPQGIDDPELRQFLDQRMRDALETIHRERAADALLTPRERIKKRLNLPAALPADYQADKSVLVLTPVGGDAVPRVVVVNNMGIGINMPRALFAYLYRQRSPTAEDQQVINDFLVQSGLSPESRLRD